MDETANLTAWRRLWPALLLLSVVALLPVGQAFEAPLAIAAALGLVYALRMRDSLIGDPGVRLAIALFACYWLAALVSAPAAIAPGKTWTTVAVLLRFLPFVLFAVLLLRNSALWPQIECAVAAVVVLWLLDAWVQIFTGYSIAGPMEAERLSGIFGADNLKLGPVLAVLSPFVLAAARDRYGGRGLAVAAVFMLMPILLAGSRAAWLMYALVVVVFLWQQTRAPLGFATWGLAAIIIAGLAAWSADRDSPAFASRVQRTLLMLRGTPSAVDEASAGRLRIWSTAGRMIVAHPVTGVGARGFRYAYPRYATAGDAFVDAKAGEGAMHAHQLALEVLSETGFIGLLLWITGAVMAIRAWRRADAGARRRAFAPGLALAVMCFPLNTHLAFYSAWWGSLFWWLLALYAAAVSPPLVEHRRES